MKRGQSYTFSVKNNTRLEDDVTNLSEYVAPDVNEGQDEVNRGQIDFRCSELRSIFECIFNWSNAEREI